jgi:hypothetical protein
MSVRWGREQPSQEDYRAELVKLLHEPGPSPILPGFPTGQYNDWPVFEVKGEVTGEPITLRRAPTDSPDGLAGYPEREIAAHEEWARLERHAELAETMLAAGKFEPMQALRAWTANARALVDALPDQWLPGQNEAEWDRLRLMVRALFGLVYSGRLEPTLRTRDNLLAAQVREIKMGAEIW